MGIARLEAQEEAGIQARRRKFRAGDVLVEPGQPADLMLLASGWVSEERPHGDGRQIVHISVPGDLVGFSEVSGLASLRLRALTPGALTVLGPANRVLTSDPRTAGGALVRAGLTARSQALVEQIVGLGALSAVGRTAQFALSLHKRLKAVGLADGDSLPMPLSQGDLANALGMSTVHLNRVLQTLRLDGLFKLKAGVGQILDLVGLTHRAQA